MATLSDAEAIYKHPRMPTVGGMFKRVLVIVGGAAGGILLATALTQLHPVWNWWPHRDLNRNEVYFRTVLDLVTTNYVDARRPTRTRLTRAALDGMIKVAGPAFRVYAGRRLPGTAGRDGRAVRRDRHPGGAAGRQGRGGGSDCGHAGRSGGHSRADEIVKIDGQVTEKLGMDKIVAQLRGEPGSKVTVTLFRPSTKATLERTLKREIIRVESVRDVRMVGDGIGYIQLTQFSRSHRGGVPNRR